MNLSNCHLASKSTFLLVMSASNCLRKRIRLQNTLCCFVLAGLLALVRPASAARYTFVNIADSRGPFDQLDFWAQAVSDTGTVAFVGYQGGVPSTYVGDGTTTTLVAADIRPPAGFSHLATWQLNESGTAVAKVECCDPRHGKIQLHEATGTRTIFELSSSEHTLLFPAINNGGTVAFSIFSNPANDPQYFRGSIIRWFDGTSTTIVDITEGFGFMAGVGLNERGDVAFQGYKYGEGYSFHHTDGTTLTLIADSSGPLDIGDTGIMPIAINDSGAVAFWSPLDSGGEGIFVGDGGPLATVAIADPTTPFYFIDDDIDMNNQGTIAFFAGLWDGRGGIFTGPDAVNDKVVAHGDLLFGQRVSGLGRPRLNNRGDIAFWYEVRDPQEPEGYRYGVALALVESPPAVLGLERVGDELRLRLTGQVGATYAIEQTPQLVSPAWTTVQTVTLTNASQQMLLSPPATSSAFWRARRL